MDYESTDVTKVDLVSEYMDQMATELTPPPEDKESEEGGR